MNHPSVKPSAAFKTWVYLIDILTKHNLAKDFVMPSDKIQFLNTSKATHTLF